jgi:diadenosine tetraphosphate (Ap4A) HIT family hydrolase
MADFELDRRLAANPHVVDWPLSSVFVENDARYTWLVLVPRRAGMREFFDLGSEDQAQLFTELTAASERLNRALAPTKMNVAMLGNMVPQLHAHVIARFEDDPAWPGPVWGVGTRVPYSDEEAQAAVAKMRGVLGTAP